MRVVDLTYYHQSEFSDPEEVLLHHQSSIGFGPFLKERLDLVFIKHTNYEGELEKKGIKYVFFKSKNKFFHIPFATHRYIRRLQPGVVIIQGLIFPLQLILLKKKLGKKVKIIAQHHAETPFTGIKGLIQKIAARYIDAYIFTAKGNAEAWQSKKIIRDPEKIFEIPEISTSFWPIERVNARKKIKMEGRFNFIVVGRLVPGKDPLLILDAFNRFLTDEPSAKLYFIYQEDQLLNEMKLKVDTNDRLKQSVEFIGKVSHDTIYEWMSAADYYISASHREACGTALMEAMACGCIPVIADIPPYRKLTGDGCSAVLFCTGDVESLYQAMIKTKAIDPAAFSNKVKDHFEEHLSFPAIADHLYDLCDQLTSE